MNRRCPSANTMSNARVDLPEPDTPVTTFSCRSGIESDRFFRLFSRAPSMRNSVGITAAACPNGATGCPYRAASSAASGMASTSSNE